MSDHRVMITGLGTISCLGSGPAEFWAGLLGGGGDPAQLPELAGLVKYPHTYLVPAADVPDEPQRVAHVPLGRGPRMGTAAARAAVADAGLEPGECSRMPVVMGVEMGNVERHESTAPSYVSPGCAEPGLDARSAGRWRPMTVTAAAVSAAVGSCASSVSVGNACAASGYALSVAADMIRTGEAETVLAGGADGTSRTAIAAFNRIGATDPVRCRPFDKRRAGTVFGEGAALFVLESADHARRRDAEPYAELAGSSWTCDAFHVTAPDPSGRLIVEAMNSALRLAGVKPDSIGVVVPHGTGTALNDVVESQALCEIFGARCDQIPLLNLKAMIGHAGAAAGAFAVLAAVLALAHGQVPAARQAMELDPECDVFIPQGGAVPTAGPAAMANAYAFGGTNVSLVLTRPEGVRCRISR